MSELIDVMFYLFLLITPFFSGLYFEKNFIVASISLFMIMMLQIVYILKNKNKIKANENIVMILKKICASSFIIFVISNFTYFYNYMFLEESLELKLIALGNVQIVEMFLFCIVCILKNKKSIDSNELNFEYMIQNFVVILSSTIISFLMFFEEFYREGRFEGTFYYANSLAIFLLITIIMIVESKFINLKSKKIEKVIKFFLVFLNLTALILTNSRFTYVLCIIYFSIKIVKLLKDKIRNKNVINFKRNILLMIFGTSILIIIAGCGFFKLVNKNEEINKRFQIETIIHDIKLRGSYLIEANEIIKEYPLGLGYEGYLKHQEIKENKYRLRLVHNMPYQITLNYGMVMLSFLAYCMYKYIVLMIKKKKLFNFINIILILTFLHSLVDIGTSFLVIDNLLILLLLRNIID